jgi:hypothetical protein
VTGRAIASQVIMIDVFGPAAYAAGIPIVGTARRADGSDPNASI